MDDVVTGHVVTGNAVTDGSPYRGWVVGHFVEPAESLRCTADVEIKWASHPAGEERAEWTQAETRTAIAVLVSGRFMQRLPGREVELSRPGDYVMWGPGVVHSWRAVEDSTVLTIRWPASPDSAAPDARRTTQPPPAGPRPGSA